MNSIVYIKSDIKNCYYKNDFFTHVKDRLSIHQKERIFIDELGVNIFNISMPPNFNKEAYFKNIDAVKRITKRISKDYAPKTNRILDYNIYSKFQKKLFCYCVTNSIQLILRINNKSIKNSCIVLYDINDFFMKDVICEIAKECKYMILATQNLKRVDKMSKYLMNNYGIAPIVTNDLRFAFKKADFIITSEIIKETVSVPIWYLDNLSKGGDKNLIEINDVEFKTPWNFDGLKIGPEILGSILEQMQEKDIQKSLKYNGIYMENILFNEKSIY